MNPYVLGLLVFSLNSLAFAANDTSKLCPPLNGVWAGENGSTPIAIRIKRGTLQIGKNPLYVLDSEVHENPWSSMDSEYDGIKSTQAGCTITKNGPTLNLTICMPSPFVDCSALTFSMNEAGNQITLKVTAIYKTKVIREKPEVLHRVH